MDFSSESETSSNMAWVNWYCNLVNNKYLCAVDQNYLKNELNFEGIESVPNFKEALHTITDTEYESDSDNNDDIHMSAKKLYGLIHSRYILTMQGVDQMIVKYKLGHFGLCQRVYCNYQPMLPVGMSDKYGEDTVKLYCPKCTDAYKPPRYHEIDGAFFGTKFPHMLFTYHPELLPKPSEEKYEPKIYGFKIHPTAYDKPTNK